jgi:hypothetical protein
MKAKHKLISEFQYVSPDKKIFILKSGTILEEYNYKVKNEVIPIDRDIVDNNPEFFEVVDWKAELLSYMRSNKMPQPAQLGKKLIPFIEEMILSGVGESVATNVDSVKEKQLEEKDTILFKREKEIEKKMAEVNSIKEQADELMAKAERREKETKTEYNLISKKSEKLDQKTKELTDKSEKLDIREAELKEEANKIDLHILSTTEKTDVKYNEMKKKIEKDMLVLSKREKELDERESKLFKEESNNKDSSIRSIMFEFMEYSGSIINAGSYTSTETYRRDPSFYANKLNEMLSKIESLL